LKYIQTNKNGVWRVKEHGDDYYLFDKCNPEGNSCEHSTGYAGHFSRDSEDNSFSVTFFTDIKDAGGSIGLWSAMVHRVGTSQDEELLRRGRAEGALIVIPILRFDHEA